MNRHPQNGGDRAEQAEERQEGKVEAENDALPKKKQSKKFQKKKQQPEPKKPKWRKKEVAEEENK